MVVLYHAELSILMSSIGNYLKKPPYPCTVFLFLVSPPAFFYSRERLLNKSHEFRRHVAEPENTIFYSAIMKVT